jgi:hypothetical protein
MRTNQESACSWAAQRRLQKGAIGTSNILLMLTAALAACTYYTPLSDDAETLHRQIRAGEAVQPGDHVRVVTHDGVSRRLFVDSVEGDVLKGYLDTGPAVPVRTELPGDETPERRKGPLVDIPIADIVLVEKETLSKGKTAAAVGAGTLVFVALLAAMAMAAVMTP